MPLHDTGKKTLAKGEDMTNEQQEKEVKELAEEIAEAKKEDIKET